MSSGFIRLLVSSRSLILKYVKSFRIFKQQSQSFLSNSQFSSKIIIICKKIGLHVIIININSFI